MCVRVSIWMHISHFEFSQNSTRDKIPNKTFANLYLSLSHFPSSPKIISPYLVAFTLFHLVCPRFCMRLSQQHEQNGRSRINKQSFFTFLMHLFISILLLLFHFSSFFALLFYTTITFRGAHCLCRQCECVHARASSQLF